MADHQHVAASGFRISFGVGFASRCIECQAPICVRPKRGQPTIGMTPITTAKDYFAYTKGS